MNADRAIARARAALSRAASPFRELPPRLLLVDVPRQRLDLIVDGAMLAELHVSTAAAGVGGEAGSLRTPPGWHRIHAKIGADAPLGAVFESRVPTGAVWGGETREDDLILTRILTLEGLEPGINQGPGHDSLERYIYLHGTNQEDRLGSPASHGCVRLSNPDIAWLFDHVEAGDPVVIVGDEGRAIYPDPHGHERFHFAGIGGSGMSALAQFQVMAGGRVSGSDRAFDRGERSDLERRLRNLGIAIHPQDGSGVRGDCAALVLSTAVESEVPDYAVARDLGVPTLHRSELLAHFVATYRTAAIAGTSGKSTVVAMTFAILRGAGLRPSLITGGELLELQREDLIGNAFSDPGSELLVIEADESDGSLVHYRPAVGAVLNLQKDHKEVGEVALLFERFRRQTVEGFVTGEDANLEALAQGASEIFGFGPRATVRGEGVELEPLGSRFTVDRVAFTLPCPGQHNVANALAAIAVCRTLGVELRAMVEPLASFAGVARRFHTVGTARGIEVIDDFAHNPAKLKAAIATARARGRRVLAVYQPHGFGPTRFLRQDLVEAFSEALGSEDLLWMLEIFYAGGTARRDFSASEIVDELRGRGVNARFSDRQRLPAEILSQARPGDVVLLMGARDPSLTELARKVLESLGSHSPATISGH
ncbi:MAG TPA: L,D-transpeptidase family protein [Candidatus Eisenbacteria bacterium]|nr:L,D-transpeptidase family protein [Candidatus Eisenbacteria bacterium]